MAYQPTEPIPQLSLPAGLSTHLPTTLPNKANHPEHSSNAASPLFSLSSDLLIHLVHHLHTLSDFISLSSTCTRLRAGTSHSSPRDLLRLTYAHQRRGRLSVYHLLLAVARGLGAWARLSPGNETLLVRACRDGGVQGLLSLAMSRANCGLTLERARELHWMRDEVFPCVEKLIERCLEDQNRAEREVLGSLVPCKIDWDGMLMVYRIGIYGEMFGPDMDIFLEGGEAGRMLAIETRLNLVQFCNESHTLAMCCALGSTRWRSAGKQIRMKMGEKEKFLPPWMQEEYLGEWKERLCDALLLCCGLPGLRMIVPELQEYGLPEMARWREKVWKVKDKGRQVSSAGRVTYQWPCLLHDLDLCFYRMMVENSAY